MAVSICVFFTVIKPEPRHWGPKVNHYRKKPQSICLLHAAHSSDSDISRTLRFYDDRGHQTYLPVFYFQTALRHSDYVPPSWIWLAGSLYAWTSSLTRFRYKNLGDREREIKQANVSQRKNSKNKMVRSKSSAKWSSFTFKRNHNSTNLNQIFFFSVSKKVEKKNEKLFLICNQH